MTKSAGKEGYKKRIKKLGHHDHVQSDKRKLTKVEASRETRKRKNTYIRLLEVKLEEKERELEETRRQLEQIRRQKGIKDNNFYSNLKQRTELFEKISQSIHNQDQTQTKTYLDMLRNKLGVAGKDRETMLYAILRQFAEFIMPMHLRYLIEACEEKKQFYELFTENSAYKLHMNFSFLDMSQKRELSEIRSLLCAYKESYKHILRQIVALYQVVIDQNRLAQDVLDNLQKAFNPCFVAEFLLKLDQKRNDNQIGAIFPMNYLDFAMRRQEEQVKQKRINEIYKFSIAEAEQIPMEIVFPNAQDDFDYLL